MLLGSGPIVIPFSDATNAVKRALVDATTRRLQVDVVSSAALTGNVGILNSADARIDPATEGTLSAFYTAWLAISPYYSLQYNVVQSIDTHTGAVANAAGSTGSAVPGTALLQGIEIESSASLRTTGTMDTISGNLRGMVRVEIGGSGGDVVNALKEASSTGSGANGIIGFSFKNNAGAVVLPALNAAGRIAVDVTAALPAGSNAIGKLAANSGVDIGDVTINNAAGASAVNVQDGGNSLTVDGTVNVDTSAVASFDHGGNSDVDNAAEQITATSMVAKKGVTVKAHKDNTGTIYIGNSDVTAGTADATDGFPLEAGEALFLEVSNANVVYAIASVANQKLHFIVV